MKNKASTLVFWAIAAAVVGGGGWLAYQRHGGNGAQPVSYQPTPVRRGRVIDSVTASGTLSPLNTVQVGSQVSGRVLEIFVDFNSPVTRGQVIATIDPRLFESDVAKARANVQSAQANVVKAQAAVADARQQYERTKALADQSLVARAEVDSLDATYKSARAQETAAYAALSLARAGLEQAQVNLAYTTIVSPIDGTVISRAIDVGQTVAASLQAPTLFTIAEDLRAMEVHTNVAESDVGKLSPEMRVEFTVDAFPGKRFRGVVKQIRNSPQTVQNVVTYDAVIRCDNDELELRPGMTATVTFIVADNRDVLVVPNAALRFNPPDAVVAQVAPELLQDKVRQGRGPRGGNGQNSGGGDREAGQESGGDAGRESDQHGERRARQSQRVVWVLADGKPRPVRIQIGISDGTVTEVSGGELEEGAAVITGMSGAGAPQKRPSGGNQRPARFM